MPTSRVEQTGPMSGGGGVFQQKCSASQSSVFHKKRCNRHFLSPRSQVSRSLLLFPPKLSATRPNPATDFRANPRPRAQLPDPPPPRRLDQGRLAPGRYPRQPNSGQLWALRTFLDELAWGSKTRFKSNARVTLGALLHNRPPFSCVRHTEAWRGADEASSALGVVGRGGSAPLVALAMRQAARHLRPGTPAKPQWKETRLFFRQLGCL